MSESASTTNTQFLRIERTEAALRLSEATKTAILETALDCIITIDHKGIVLDWNPAAERTFGYSLAEAVGREMAELIIPIRYREMHRRGLARAVETGGDPLAGQRIEISAIRKSGDEFPVELSIARIGIGPTPLFTGHVRDITKRKTAERELRESQQLLSSITSNINEAIFRRSPKEGLVFVNHACVRLFGYDSVGELQHVPAEQLYANAERRTELVARLSRNGVVRNEEVEFRRKDGTTFWGLMSANGIYDEKSGEVLYFDGAIHDITERKQTEQRLAVQYAVASALADSATLNEAAPRILEAVGQSLLWDAGTIWQIAANGEASRARANGRKEMLRCVDLWHRPGLAMHKFMQATGESVFAPGEGVPGRIWKTGQPTWVSDVLKDRNFPRGPIAAVCGLHSCFGFPISLGSSVLGVIEFFSREIREPDGCLLDMFSAIGSQIGQFIERKRIEEEIRDLNKDLEQRVKNRTAQLTAANTALRESEGRYRTVAEHVPAALVVMDVQAGRFVEANENAVRLYGMPREALLKVGPLEVSPPFQPDGRASAKAAKEKIQNALKGRTPVFEWIHRRGDGTDIPCEIRVARMPASGRDLVIGAVVDITVRKKAEAELRAALEQEKELSQLKSNFVTVVSHEFRTPLGVIMSGADILEHYFDRLQPEKRASHLQDIRHATRQMTALMEEVLLLGKVESGKMECRPQPINLPEFCQRLLDEQRSATSDKCRIVLKLSDVPSQAHADEAVMRHIFSNLLSNAVKYSPARATVHFTVTKEEADAVFEVRDSGIGIPLPDQKALFEAFHRGANVGEIPGTGLGMVIVKRCVDMHHGTIEFSSAPNRGTTFRVRLRLFASPRRGTKTSRKRS